MAENPTAEEFEDMVQIGMLAWNLSIPKTLGIPGYKEILNSAIAEAGFGKKHVELAKKLEKQKLKRFSEYTQFIESYKLVEDGENGMQLMLNCTSLVDMMADEMNFDDDDDELDDDDFPFDDEDDNTQFEEGILYRSAFSLKHKPAYIEWAKKATKNPGFTGNVIYLIEEKDSEEEAKNWLKKNFKKLMEGELEEVTINKKKWPKLTYTVFCDFFEAQYHSMIWDTVEEPLEKF